MPVMSPSNRQPDEEDADAHFWGITVEAFAKLAVAVSMAAADAASAYEDFMLQAP